MNSPFTFARMPVLEFGAGRISRLPALTERFGRTVLFVTGKNSFVESKHWEGLQERYRQAGHTVHHCFISHEPSPSDIDSAVAQYRDQTTTVVVAIGGGSVIDAGKAIAAMVTVDGSVRDYLEGVGTAQHPGTTLPFVAVPTTAGTGSEATKNAVLSEVGPQGFKKSLRHENFVPHTAIIDPELMLSCPRHITAACAMDAFTQLLEAYVSKKSSPLTDALAFDGIRYVADNIEKVCSDGAGDIAARGAMAYGAFLSGVTLANAGLGVVHGFASSVGGFLDIPHGVVCGALLPTATRITVESLQETDSPENRKALGKYGRVGHLLTREESLSTKEATKHLVDTLNEWAVKFELPKLGSLGLTAQDIPKIITVTGNKNNPALLNDSELERILSEQL